MTREEMARRLDDLGVHVADVAAAELRKSCAGCIAFGALDYERWPSVPWCSATSGRVPADGSGFCHRWEAK